MKVAINIQADIQEIEVIINCMAEDVNVQRIVSALDSCFSSYQYFSKVLFGGICFNVNFLTAFVSFYWQTLQTPQSQ